MTFKWSDRSKANLAEVDIRLKHVFDKALELGVIDIVIIEGHRNEARQTEMVRTKKSELEWPNSKHNAYPSKAVDAIPYPFSQADWGNKAKLSMFAGFIVGVGASMGIKIRAGADWDGNFNPLDNWQDFPHFELMD